MKKRTKNNPFSICKYCGTKTRFWNTHHKNEDKTDNRKENLATVCLECHKALHSTRYGMVQTKVHSLQLDAVHDMGGHREGFRITEGYKLLNEDNY